jgi:hypothetical protein
MYEAPPIFQESIDQHNRHCWMSALFSLFSCWFAWLIFAGVYGALALLFETIRVGGADLDTMPPWLVPLGAGIMAFLFVWATIDKMVRRFQPPPDRNIIGWHLAPDLLLLPARMTLAIWDHIGARIKLSPAEREQAWELLQMINVHKRVPLTAMNLQIADAPPLEKLILALQITHWIDLHRGQDEWFYRVRSDAEETLLRLTQGPTG